MRVRIVVANQGEAAFYDVQSPRDPPRFMGRMSDPLAHLHDRDFKSDRPGRVFDHAPPANGRRGAVPHHGTGGERRPKRQEALVFARRVAGQLEHAERNAEFDRLVMMAAPAFLGLLRKTIPGSLRTRVAAEVTKDLVHETPGIVQAHVPAEVFHEPPA